MEWRPPWTRRAAQIAAAALLGPYLVYVVVANLLLGTGLVAKIVSRDPETITLEYERAWTIWFGRVHAGSLALHGSARTLEWALRSEDASLDVHLHELLFRRFHADRVRGERFSFRMRLRLTPDEADLPAARALPSIPGFADPPLLAAGPPEAIDDAHYDLWTTHLEDVDVGVSEIWIQHYRFEGEGRTTGGFRMKPQRVVEVTPSVMNVRSGVVTLAGEIVATRTEGRVDCTLVPFDPRTITGLNAFESVIGEVALDAEIPGLKFLDFYVPPSSASRLEDGSGAVRAELSIRRGVLGPRSSLTYETAHLDVGTPDLTATLRGLFHLHTADDVASTTAILAARVPRLTLDRPRMKVPPMLFERTSVDVEVPALDLADPPRRAAIRVDVPAAVIPDLRWANPVSPAAGAPRFTGGAAFFQARLSMTPEGVGSGRIGALAKKMTVRFRDTTIRGDSEAKIRVDRADPFAPIATFGKSHVSVRDVVIERKGDVWPAWWSDIDVTRGELGPTRIGASFQARCKDSRPAIELLESGGALPEWAGGLLRGAPVTLDGSLDHRPSGLDFNLLRARADTLDVRGRLRKPDRGKAEGAFLLKSGPLSLGVAFGEEGSAIKPFEDDAWLDRRLATVAR